MSFRLYVDQPLGPGLELDLPEGPARHVQVRRLQPGQDLTLFNGQGGEWRAEVVRMGRREVSVRCLSWSDVSRELPTAVTLAVGMPANERFDWLVEKAAELGATAIQPLMTERSVLRLQADRAERKRQHWQAVAHAACEQCGRTRPMHVHEPAPLLSWLTRTHNEGPAARWVLDPGADTRPSLAVKAPSAVVLSGPEGGLTDGERDQAHRAGFQPCSLGPRVLRAETAPLAALVLLSITG